MKKYDFITLLVSVVAGVIWWFVGEYVFEAIADRLWMPLVIGIYFAGLAFFVIAAIFISTAIRGFSLPEGGSYGKSAALLAVILAAAFLFQFLYALDVKENDNGGGTSYIFLLDKSSSMRGNDPGGERLTALRNVVSELSPNASVAVYMFNMECEQVVPMMKAGDFGSVIIPGTATGGTDICNALETIMDDIDSGRLNAGSRPKIILLSDGEVSTVPQELLDRVNNAGATISTVALSVKYAVNLQSIADATGGVNVYAENATALAAGMREATREIIQRDRTLVSAREPMKLGFLYGLLRTVFLLLIGLGFMIIKSLLLRTNVENSSVLVENVIAVAIGAIGTELGMNILYQPEHTVRIVLCIMFCLLITEYDNHPEYIDGPEDDELEPKKKRGSISYDELPPLADDDDDDDILL